MRFERVRLSNFKCYDDADVRLDRGVTVIHGLNGSGKSSLLEACFFALYGSKGLENELGEIVTIGADDTEVELWFAHAGDSYHVERRVRATGERPTTAKCVLEGPDETVEGARDVRAYVEELLRMDADAFVNCAYVRQGEVNKLINATPAERQDMLDSLLQLGKLEEYRERASDARVGVDRVRRDKRGSLSQLDDQIEAKEDENLHARLNDHRTELESVTSDIDRFEQQREKAVETRDQAAEILDSYEDKRAELDDLESDIEGLREAISETERDREDLSETISDRREARADHREELAGLLPETELSGSADDPPEPAAVESLLDDLAERDDELQETLQDVTAEVSEHGTRAENLRESADDLESQAESKREQADDLDADVAETREKVADKREQIADLEERIESLEGEFEDAPAEFGAAESFREEVAEELSEVRETVASLDADVKNQREAIEEAESLLAEGKCPECGQDVDGSPHVESIDDDRERLADLETDLEAARERRDDLEARLEEAERLVDVESEVRECRSDRSTFEQLVDQREDTLEEKVEQAERLREEADEAESDAAEKREAAQAEADAAEASRERVGEINAERGTIRERRERLERVDGLLAEIADATDAVERLRERREQLEETNDERRERLAEKRERRSDLQEEFDEDRIEGAREQREKAADYIEQADAKLEGLRERRDELQSAVGGVEAEIEELESLRERREALAERVEWLDSLYDEAEQLQRMYGDLRAELRRRNVESLEAMLNEIFDLVYQNDSYARIELSGEYELTVYQKDGEPLDPEQLSGGERALFNLSLRCAIYRLLAEGIEGAAPMPPLILDEPTVFLDSGHVSQLVELVEAMRDYGVEQILVVSHDDELVGAADDLVRVEKDSTTNRSSVRRERPEDRIAEAVEADD
ncbi:chromosome segregation protein [Halosimplex carlsbadense 2-9-1]|uniref:DNA double-strand break repair Rad50 ATPase n=1 Tax=Halosimplex carlsbadense 2-9-1 TaxID=797114 RepID=M0CP44_9EURY|nr:DNA double-strand break repair ATPase Rad50 [Halosimplex carlsbadense]ELZ25015.1 chromosome segregation protein [Halosimplex carlsbadense 2-9-1]